MTKKKNPNRGSSLEDFLAEDGRLDEATAVAIKRVVAWQIAQEMERTGMNKTQLAEKLGTNRTQVNRLLDPDNDGVTLRTLQRAADAVGRKLRVELV
jgi:antitoxin HicB